jgi:secreted trypsin-like serine protease
MICAGQIDAGGIGVCQGDSGGPLQYEYNGQWYQAGIASWTVGCAWKGYPGVLARVTQYLDFIKTTSGLP